MNLARHGLLLDSEGHLAWPDLQPESDEFDAEAPESDDWSLESFLNSVLLSGFETLMRSTGFEVQLLAATKKPRKKSRKRNRKKKETPQQYRDRVKKELEILELDVDILDLKLKDLRRYFGYDKGTIKLGPFVRNVIWQVYQQTQAGNPPTFVRNGGNIRSLWYHVKPLVRRHSRSFSTSDLGDLFSAQLTVMTSAGLLGYRDLNLVDSNSSGRWVAPSYGTSNVILMAEKSAFSSKFIELGKQYGVTVQTTGGTSSRVTVDTLLSEMAEAGHDLTKPFTVFSLVDLDHAGWNIAGEFVEQMKDLGLKKVRAFRPYGKKRPLQPWVDIVSTADLDTKFLKKYRFKLKVSKRQRALSDEWINATGGLYGKNGKTYGLAADELIDLVDEQLARKLPKYLERKPAEFQRLAALDSLTQMTKEYLTTRILAESD